MGTADSTRFCYRTGLRPTDRPADVFFEYDTLGFVSSITDADERVTSYSMDHVSLSGDGMLTVTYPDGGQRQILPISEDVYNVWRTQLGTLVRRTPRVQI